MSVEEIKDAIERFPFSIAMYNPSYGINMGAVLRSCNAFGATEFIRIGSKKFDRRAAIGTQNYEDIKHFKTWDASLNWMRQKTYHLVGVDWTDNSVSLQDVQYPKQAHVVFIMGNERSGLPREVLEVCDEVVHINQYGSIPSLNVAVASSIIMYDWHEKRRRNE